MSSGTNVEVNATSMTPSAPVGGADALAPLTAALDKLHTALSSVETTIKALDIGKAFTVTLSNELSAFVSRFDTILTQFTNKFNDKLDKLLSNITVTAKGGKGKGGLVQDDDEEENPIIRAAKKRRKNLQFERDVRAELETRAHSKGTLHEPWKPFNRSSIPNKLYSNIPKVPMSMRSEDEQFKAYIATQQKRGRFKDRAVAEGFMPGPLSKMDKQVKTVEEEVKDLLDRATRRKEVESIYNKQAESMGLPTKGGKSDIQIERETNLKEAAKEKIVREKQEKEAQERKRTSLIVRQTDYGVKADKVAGSFLDNFKKSMEASKKAMTIPSPYNRNYLKNLSSEKDYRNFVTPTGSYSGTFAGEPKKFTAVPSPYSTFFRRGMSSDKEWKNFVTPTGSFGGLPPSTPKVTNGTGGFDWKKLLGAAGLGFAFTGGAGVAAAAIVKLLPKVVKAFEPVIDLGNALVDSLDPLAETINSALTPFRDLANQLKRFSVLGGFGASFNMNRINAQFESNLNDLMGSMLETVSSIFSNPLAGIMNAASMIGKFVDMVDPAAMALFQQTMRDTFAVIGTALRPAMFELSKMLRSFADHLHPVLQGAMPRIMSGLESLATAFEKNLPLITLMIEKFVGDFTKQIDKSGSLFENALDPKKLMKDFENYQKGIKVKEETGGFEKAFERFVYRTDREFELKKGFQSTANLILKLAGKEGGIEKNKDFLTSFLKTIIDKTKPASTVGLARVTDASYGGVAEVGREAVRRAFEGSRLQDLTRKNNREDIETATYNAFIKALEQWSSGSKIYAGPEPEGIHSGTQFYPKPVR
jgi:hypothetical protein